MNPPGLRWFGLLAVPLFAVGCAAPHVLPDAIRAAAPAEPAPVARPAPAGPRTLPIDLDTVLRLAGENNPQIQLARAELSSSEIEREQAKNDWLPAINLGMIYYRHEGGIQNEDGSFLRSSMGAVWPGIDVRGVMDLRQRAYREISAERQVHQTDAELARITSENLLEAANTYFDLLAARTAEALLTDLGAFEKKSLDRAQDLYKQQPAEFGTPHLLVETLKSQTTGRQQALLQVRQQGDAAAAKLAYLLGLGEEVCLAPIDAKLDVVELVDARTGCDDLVQRALSAGPGVRQLENLLGVVQDAIDRSRGPSQYIPVVEMRMLEGGFGAGPDSNLTWANRWDMGVQVRWNLTEYAQAKEKRRLAESKRNEIQLNMQDLRGRLTLGVRESQQSILNAQAQMPVALSAVEHARNTYRISEKQMTENVEGSSPTQVMGAIRGLETAQLGYLNLLRAHNKAQARLLVLTGATLEGCAAERK